MKLFDRFDETFCINLDKREDRLVNFQKQVDKYDLGKFTKVSAVDGSTINLSEYTQTLNHGELGLILTNQQILKNSIEKNYETILIIEDDCSFSDEVVRLDEYFDLLPQDWDMLYMGGNHNLHMGVDPPVKINSKVVKLHDTYSTHFIAIKRDIFETIDSMISKYQVPLDVSYVEIQKLFNVYSFYPAIASQIVDYSDIQNQITDYRWLIK